MTYLLDDVLSKLGGGMPAAVQTAFDKISGATEYNRSNYENLKTDRGTVALKDLHELFRPIAFGEVSNDPTTQEDEVRGILNTAFNRQKAMSDHTGTVPSLKDVLTQQNAYQAYQPDNAESQYALYTKGGNTLDAKKKQTVDDIVSKLVGELKDGTFADNTQGAAFYSHKDGKIVYDSKTPFYKKEN